ncbi:MAG: hypothetical protein AAF558_13870 [Verrucomicrobiota bacterium]
MEEHEVWKELSQSIEVPVEVDGVTSLWRAVLVQVIIDAKTKAKCREQRKAKAEALAWLSQPEEGSDFALICDLAGLSPSATRKAVKQIMRGDRKISFSCMRKERSERRLKLKIKLTNQGDYDEKSKPTDQSDSCRKHPCRCLDQSK